MSKKEAAPEKSVQEQSKEISILLDGNKIANVLTNYLASHGNDGEVPK